MVECRLFSTRSEPLYEFFCTLFLLRSDKLKRRACDLRASVDVTDAHCCARRCYLWASKSGVRPRLGSATANKARSGQIFGNGYRDSRANVKLLDRRHTFVACSTGFARHCEIENFSEEMPRRPSLDDASDLCTFLEIAASKLRPLSSSDSIQWLQL
jgi:hypothetical protein